VLERQRGVSGLKDVDKDQDRASGRHKDKEKEVHKYHNLLDWGVDLGRTVVGGRFSRMRVVDSLSVVPPNNLTMPSGDSKEWTVTKVDSVKEILH
jgi:hypothetical protein